jgi:two-component system sensor histidine kinase MprB
MSLRSRIAAVVGAAIAAVVVLTAIFTYVAVRSQLRGEVDDSLTQRASTALDAPMDAPRMVPRGFGRAPVPGVRQLLTPPPGDPFSGGAAGFAQLIFDGRVVGPPNQATLPLDASAQRIAADGGRAFTDMTVDGVHLRVLTQGVRNGLALQVARPLTEIDDQLSRILIALVVIGAIGVLGGAALGAFLARTALVPVARFTARTEALRDEADLSQRMDVVGNDELARLARSFNATLDELERSVSSQRQLVADASHELRTPIASLRANIQMLGDADRLPPDDAERMRADIVSELDELTALVGDVVELARGAERPKELDDVRLDRVIETVVERERRRVGGRVALDVDLEPSVVAGDAERIGRAVSNLVGNAVKWSPAGGVVEVGLADGVVSVRDHGPGFGEEDLPHVFERFYRAAAARGTSGSGLGLAIVKQAAEAHGGFAEAANADGGGALLRVGFGPALAPSAVPPERSALS